MVQFVKIKLSDGAAFPRYATPGSAGFDISANHDIVVYPDSYARVHTGLFVELPEGKELQIRSRSGLAARHGVIVHQGVGTIDSDYRGEIVVMLRNVGLKKYCVSKGDRIAQGVVCDYDRVVFDLVSELSDSVRGEGGFGSTGYGETK